MPRLVWCVGLFALALSLYASRSSAAEAVDPPYNLNEFPPLPTPTWVRPVDLGGQDPALAGIQAPAGIKVEIVAHEPVVVNPVGLTFDAAGRLFVLEWKPSPGAKHRAYEVTFQDGTKATVNCMQKDARDHLKLVADADGDGKYDTARVVFDDLEIPSSVLVHDGWIYLSSLGRVMRRKYEDAGEGLFKITKEEEIVRGLCGFHHHQASGMTLSNDGWLFVSSGDDDNHGEGSDGSRATVLRTGAIFRMRPDGKQLTEFARGFRNPYRDVAFDHFGNMFHVDNDQEDGSKFQGVRMMHIQEGDDFGWRLAAGAVCCRTDFSRGAVFGERPGKTPSMLKTGRGSPAGLLIYQGTAFPAFFRGLFIYPDVYRKMVRAYAVERSGATFRVTHQFELMKSEDGLFRPCQAVTGPDGAIYILDWRTDSGGAGRLWGDGVHGRIYRLTWQGTPDTQPAIARGSLDAWAKLQTASEAQLDGTLDALDFELRRRALEELVRRGESQRERLIAIAKNANRPIQARAFAMGGACQFYTEQVQDMLVQMLDREADPELRRLAADLIARNATAKSVTPDLVNACLRSAVGANHAAVRVAAMQALGHAAALLPAKSELRSEVADMLVSLHRPARLAGANDRPLSPTDVALSNSCVRALEALGEPGTLAILASVVTGQDEEHERAVQILEAMRTGLAASTIDTLLVKHSDLFIESQLARLMETYRHILIEPRVDASEVGKWLAAHPDASLEVQIAALETLGLTGAATEGVTPLVLKLLSSPDAEARKRVMQMIGDSRLVAAARPLVDTAKNAARPLDERRMALQKLAQLRSLPMPFTNQPSPPGVELVLDDLVAIAADAAQPPELRADALSVVGQVNFGKAAPLALAQLEGKEAVLVTAAIDLIGSQPAQAKELGQRFLAGKIDRSFLPQVARVLQKHAAADKQGEFAALAAQVLKGGLLASATPEDLAKVESLVVKGGNPERGKAIYFDMKRTQCANCHKLEGVGGQVGPDLSKVWQTHTVPKLLETILDPSKEIKEGYATWSVTTIGGQVYVGLKVQDDEREVVIREASGRDVRVPKSEVDEKLATNKSLMPEGLAATLSFEEMVDLVAFLKSESEQAKLKAK